MALLTPTYEGIIKGFTKTIEKLEALAARNAAKEAETTARIKELKNECVRLEEEGKKAMATATKLKDLF